MIKELMTSNRNKTEIDYDKIIKKEMERRKFINFTKDSVIENNQVDTLKNFINLVNSIIFAGFDYYYDKEFDSDLIKNAIDNNKKINILINEDFNRNIKKEKHFIYQSSKNKNENHRNKINKTFINKTRDINSMDFNISNKKERFYK